jgi:SAM-dependent methyltransferase
VQESVEQIFARHERALAADPRRLDSRLTMAAILSANGYALDAAQFLFEGFAFAPADARLRGALASTLEGLPLDTAAPAARAVLLDLARDDNIGTQALADAIVGVLKTAGADAQALSRDPLAYALLERTIVNDAGFERALTAMRRELLLGRMSLEPSFVRALEWQCFHNEYAWFVTAEEAAALERRPSPLYAPGPEQQALRDEEIALARQIEAITPIRSGVSADVRALYEENPYPRWLGLLRPAPLPRQPGPPPTVLVAGGGTGQHPIHTALSRPDSDVLAVDLSRASLAYATRMAKRYGASNLSFRQADILELGALGRHFDIIESIGVLHHLEDPLAGWRVLAGMLKPGGSMRIGLYSAIARKPLQAARILVREREFPSTPEGIRAARQAIIALPEDDPARSVLESDDFYSASGCRDLVMHVQEHAFTLPHIAQYLGELGLRFEGFEQSPEVLARFQALNPDRLSLTDLAAWDRFEQGNPEVFRGMYRFVCTRV